MSDVDFVQYLLIWTGDYNGTVDGVFGPQTQRAYQDFILRKFGRLPPEPTSEHFDALVDDAAIAMGQAGFALFRDRELDVTFGVPQALLLPATSKDQWRRSFQSPDGTIELEVTHLRERYTALEQLFRKLRNVPGRTVSYSAYRPNWFVMSGTDRDRNFYLRYHAQGSSVRGFAVSYPPGATQFERVVIAMSNVFRPSADANDGLIRFLDEIEAQIGSAPEEPEDEGKGDYSGSGFAISFSGTIVTNAHVVDDCKRIEVPKYGEAKLVTIDPDYDLAVLRLSRRKPASVAQIQMEPIKLGQTVVILGYPLSDLMGNSLSVTTGIVSSLSGLGGTKGIHTLTANIQPGNSGGPVLDKFGNVVGVAVAKLNEAAMLQKAGTTGANIGFMISAERLLDFLDPFKTLTTQEKSADELSVEAITDSAKAFTVQVFCRN